LLDDLAGNRDRYTVDVLLTQDEQRVTYGTGASSVTTVYRSDGSMCIWDRRTRSFVELGVDDVVRTSVLPSGRVEIERADDGETLVVTTEDDALGPTRHEITVAGERAWAPYGAALLRVLHCGRSCHEQSGLPWEDIAEAGLITSERTFVGDSREPTSELTVGRIALVDVAPGDFAPPPEYRRLDEVMKSRVAPKPPPPAPDPDMPHALEVQAGTVQQALDSDAGVTRQALAFERQLTPDCLGSTRFGSVAATLHQDLLTVASNTVNLVAPLLGPTTIAGGAWTIPWLANLVGLGPTAPGSGIAGFLREARTVTSPPGPTGGGRGLLDRLAFRSLYERDGSGLMRTQRDFAATTLPTTLASWGIPAASAAATSLTAASGNLAAIPPRDQRTVTEGYETRELGVLTITGLPATLPAPPAPPFSFGSITVGSVTTPPMFTASVTGIAGTVNFASLGGGPFITAATIGGSGDIVLGLALPTVTVTGTILRALTPFGGLVLGLGTIGFCFAMPFLCPFAVTLVTLAGFVLTNVTTVTATATGVTWTLDVSWAFDPSTSRVEPFVTNIGRTGTVTVGTFGRTPNIIANAVDALIAALGNLFDLWGAALALGGAAAIQQALRDQGLQLPVAGSQNELQAVGGSAVSTAGSILQLEADIEPTGLLPIEPFTTQVPTRSMVRQQLLVAHLNMRRDLNPQPVTPPPGPGPVITVGTFVGLGLSQNALNAYLVHQWLQQRFEIVITDPPTIARWDSVVPGLFPRVPLRIHLWPAVPPRVEIAPHELATGARPLVLFFDDVRACFELGGVGEGTPTVAGAWEVSCDFDVAATIEVSWPWVFSLRADQARSARTPLEPRTWEFVDPNRPLIMTTVAPADLGRLVELIAEAMLAPLAPASNLGAPPTPRPWTRPLPAEQQELFPTIPPPAGTALRAQQFYLELLGRRKALYALPAIDTDLLELVDGSGAPTFNTFLALAGAPPPIPTTLFAMRRAQGAALRNLILAFTGPPLGP
jgi:hypothetical protein